MAAQRAELQRAELQRLLTGSPASSSSAKAAREATNGKATTEASRPRRAWRWSATALPQKSVRRVACLARPAHGCAVRRGQRRPNGGAARQRRQIRHRRKEMPQWVRQMVTSPRPAGARTPQSHAAQSGSLPAAALPATRSGGRTSARGRAEQQSSSPGSDGQRARAPFSQRGNRASRSADAEPSVRYEALRCPGSCFRARTGRTHSRVRARAARVRAPRQPGARYHPVVRLQALSAFVRRSCLAA